MMCEFTLHCPTQTELERDSEAAVLDLTNTSFVTSVQDGTHPTGNYNGSVLHVPTVVTFSFHFFVFFNLEIQKRKIIRVEKRGPDLIQKNKLEPDDF